MPPADLNRVFFLQLTINGSTMGSLSDFAEMLELMDRTATAPVIDSVRPMREARSAFADMLEGNVNGKLVLVND